METEKDTTTHISAKLNPEFDRELIEQINSIPKRERSFTYREALKKYFKDKKNEELK
ncbi:hypothetical protein MKY29_14240 [Psychrobacillus sp. FSL K6-2365]|uniref:hypothetical protein n=1 Tax=Psychrobacillus sp. FSL K6-2365 TaxID=2921546 RepID=UPI0030F6854B